MNFCHYNFKFFEKGFQVEHTKDNPTLQYIPFTQIVTIRNEYFQDDKMSILTIILKDLKYTYLFKGREQGEEVYKKIISYL